jgi:hypothetical protein
MAPTTLTKTRFTMAMECPRKLDYARDKNYYDARVDDEFLASLAEGGHQVGELARQMFPGGHLIADIDPANQIRHTQTLLAQPTATVFEATIRHGNLLVRCHILRKTGNDIELIEVKATGFDSGKDRLASTKTRSPPCSCRVASVRLRRRLPSLCPGARLSKASDHPVLDAARQTGTGLDPRPQYDVSGHKRGSSRYCVVITRLQR